MGTARLASEKVRKTKQPPGVAISRILDRLEELAPVATAEEWDNVGLLVGDRTWKTNGAVVSVDLTREALDTARKQGFGLIVLHHPCIFPKSRGLSKLVNSGAEGSRDRLIFEALRAGIAIVACHTNFDKCSIEVVERVAEGLGIAPKGRATPAPQRASEAVTAALAPLADRLISVSAPTVAPYEVDSGNSRGYTVCVSVTLRDARP